MKTRELKGAALDWTVAKIGFIKGTAASLIKSEVRPYSTDWAYGGAIIEREKITWDGMAARIFVPERDCSICAYGPTILIAAMRCYVARKLGDEVEIPEGLTNEN